MLDREEIALAIELHRKAYGLLRWISDAVAKGELTFSRAHEYATASESFRDWLVTYTRQVPGRWRPRMSVEREVDMFANLFASYLLTSFELVAEPGLRLATADRCCTCAMCQHLVAAPHLRLRRISVRERTRARALKLEHLGRLAAERQQPLTDELARVILDGEKTAEATAIATYGYALVARCNGSPGEPALLALWREFAWTQAGSPRKGFEFETALCLDAEALLTEAIAG
jgi:hypothetical protein